MSSKNAHGISTSRQNQPNQNRERRQRQQQQQQHNNNNSNNVNNNSNNNNNNLNNSNSDDQHPIANPSDSFDRPSTPQALANDKEQHRTLATRQQSHHQNHPHTKAPVIVRQPSIFATFSRNIRSFLPLSSTALPPVVTGADVGGTNIGVGLGAGSRRRPMSLGSSRAANTSGGSIHPDVDSSNEETITFVQWCDVEDVDGVSHPYGGTVGSPRWLVIGYTSGVQIWDTSNLSSVREVLNLRNGCLHVQGRILHAAILPAPSTLDGVTDEFTLTRPLIGVLTSSQFIVYSLPSQSVVKQVSLKDATQFNAGSNFIAIASVNPTTLHILSVSSLAVLHVIHLPSSIYPSIALSLRLLAYTSPPPPHLHLYGFQNVHTKQTFISRTSQRRERGERNRVSPNSLRDTIGTSMIRVGGEVWSGMKALAAVSPINIGGGSSGVSSGPIGTASSVPYNTLRGYSKSAPAETMSAVPLASNIDPNLSSSTATGANWVTVLDLKPLLHGGSPRVVSRFAPFSSDSLNRGDISQLWFGSGSGTGAIPMLCVAPRDGQRVAVFQIRIHRPVPLSSADEVNELVDKDATLEMPLHWYDLRRGLTSAKVENMVWDKMGKWVGVSTAKKTIHIFAPNPYGGPTDRFTHLSTKVSNSEQMQPLSTELSPIVRLRPSDTTTATLNTIPNNNLETASHVAPLSYIFIPSNVSNTLPSSLLPQTSSSSRSSSPATSFPLRSSSSPQLHAALPKKHFQDILVFDPTTGEMILYRVILDWSFQGSSASVDQSASSSIPSTAYNNASGYSFSLPIPDLNSTAARRMSTSGTYAPTVVDTQGGGTLVGKESVLATWNLKRGRDWPEVKGVLLCENPSVANLSGKRKDFPDFIAQAELSPFSLSPGILPKSIYLSHQFSFYVFSTWDYHALLNSHQLNGIVGDEIVFRRDVEISGSGGGKDDTENAEEEMIFGFGDTVDLQGGSDVKPAVFTASRRSSASRTAADYGTFDAPIARAIHSELDYSGQSPPTIPMFPNGVPAASGVSGKSPTSRILDHSIPPPLRRGAVVAGAVAAEGFGRIRREVGSMMRSPVLRPVRTGASERRRSVGGTSIATSSSSVSASPSPRALEPMPLEFDETDEVFLEDAEDIVQTDKNQSQGKYRSVGDTLKVFESETTSTSGSIGVGPDSGASATASVSTPRTQPDEVSLEVPIGWSDSQGDEAWDDEARATVAEAEMFDEISVTGFMDEDMGRYGRKK